MHQGYPLSLSYNAVSLSFEKLCYQKKLITCFLKLCSEHNTVVPLLRDHPVVHTKVVFEEGWSFIRGRKQCKPKHVSSGIVVLNVRWSLIRGGGGGGSLKRGTTVACYLIIF